MLDKQPEGTELDSHGALEGQMIKEHHKVNPSTAGQRKASCLSSKGDKRQRKMIPSVLIERNLDSGQRNAEGKVPHSTLQTAHLSVACDSTLVQTWGPRAKTTLVRTFWRTVQALQNMAQGRGTASFLSDFLEKLHVFVRDRKH